MNLDNWLPLMIVLSSLLPGIIIFCLPERSVGLRTTANMVGATDRKSVV